MVAIFTYDFETAKENFKTAHCPLITLSDYNVLIATAEADSFISANDVASLSEWRKDPAGWKK